MSHHLDTPLAGEHGQRFIDDLFVFPGTAGTVLVMDVNSDVTGAHAEPGFDPGTSYEFTVRDDLTFRCSFGPPDASGTQAVRLDDGGSLVVEGRTGEPAGGDGVRLWAGRTSDPFYIDLSLLGAVNSAVRDGTAPDLSKWRPDAASNSFAGTTVESIVIEISHDRLPPGTRLGVWCATREGDRQVNRAGHPMMWPIFWPDDVHFTNPANARHPAEDRAADGAWLAGKVAAVVAAVGTSDDPAGYGRTVAEELLPDVLPYTVGTPATYTAAARNGRPLADNAPEAMLSLVTNTAVPSGLTPTVAAAQRSPDFPYVVPRP
ncbi:DUF4331 family protein [Dactylosporangium sp. NPDC005572]|uniref:DUF4331 family protein n=1 Tax=Dactylosporangium sp. NPDC005572 TaxID=3156889 RepID=UPI0033A0A35D